MKLASISFERDATLFALPIAAGFPQVLVYLALAGALAAALAALASSLVTGAAILAEDVIYGLPNETAPDAARMSTARLALLGVAFVTIWLAMRCRPILCSCSCGRSPSARQAPFSGAVAGHLGKRTNAWGALAAWLPDSS